MTSAEVTGWLFDAYPVGPRMVFWIKTLNGNAVRITDDWAHSIYVGCNNTEELMALAKSDAVTELVSSCQIVNKRERITEFHQRQVLRLTLKDSARALTLGKRIESLSKFGQFRLYNVDVLPAQSYFYEHDLFPLALCEFTQGNGWSLKEEGGGVWSTTYTVPEFREVQLTGAVQKESKLAKFSDNLHHLSVKIKEDSEVITIESSSEADMLQELNRLVKKLDPDIIFTVDGDAFFLPYLAHRAAENGVTLVLGRDPEALIKPKKDGISYFSYGKINFKPTAVKLKGRMHLDVNSSFAYSVGGLHGLYEVARICRLPLQNASRASIGKCLSSLQFYNAYKQNLLVPWKPVIAEHFKTREELIIADRGGLIFEPEVGVHEQVAELDFVSLYPNIMHKKNLSAETIKCTCCPDSTLRVPELDYNICQKRKGLIPISLDIVLKKRREYKRLKSSAHGKERDIFDARQTSLKWILVTSFGYLGFSNAKFGRIDAHIGVCAFDRQVLIQAADTAEQLGYKVLHGIVDSIWVKTTGAKQEHYSSLKAEIEKSTGFDIAFEGVYKWLVFLPSNTNPDLPVANRYFGAFEDGKLKIRGSEARRHDTPTLFSKCQTEMLERMAIANNLVEVKNAMPEVEDIFWRYATQIRLGKASLEDLVFYRRASKASGEFEERRTVEGDARHLLESEGKPIKAGEGYAYIITDSKAHHGSKTMPLQMLDEHTSYDVKRYVELLARVANTICNPFGYSIDEKKVGQKTL